MSNAQHTPGRLCDVLAAMDALRALRLWHWRKAKKARQQADAARRRGKACAAQGFNNYSARLVEQAIKKDDEANQHIKFVQTLNEFFPLGDYAEYDENPNERKGLKNERD